MSRLNTLHEVIHAFIGMYICRSCPSYDERVENLDGYGLVWQRIRWWVEFAAPNAIGLPLKLAGLEAIQANWKEFEYLPSPQELDMWELVDED